MGHAGKGNSDVIKRAEKEAPQPWLRHPNAGDSYAGYYHFSGCEVEASGKGDWSQAKFDAAFYLAAALCILCGRSPAVHIHHAQWTSRKIDTVIYPDRSTYPWPPAGSKVGWNGSIDYVQYTAEYMQRIKEYKGQPSGIILPGVNESQNSLVKPPVEYVVKDFRRPIGGTDEGDDVLDVQLFLRGLEVPDFNPGVPNGTMSTQTTDAIRRWQEFLGVGADGESTM